jgi:hypothetical protein
MISENQRQISQRTLRIRVSVMWLDSLLLLAWASTGRTHFYPATDVWMRSLTLLAEYAFKHFSSSDNEPSCVVSLFLCSILLNMFDILGSDPTDIFLPAPYDILPSQTPDSSRLTEELCAILSHSQVQAAPQDDVRHLSLLSDVPACHYD